MLPRFSKVFHKVNSEWDGRVLKGVRTNSSGIIWVLFYGSIFGCFGIIREKIMNIGNFWKGVSAFLFGLVIAGAAQDL